MNDALIGVVIGGLLTGSGTWIANWLQHKKWKTEQKIRILEDKRNRIEELSGKTLAKLSVGIQNNSFDIQMLCDIRILFPDNVYEKFNEFMKTKDKDDSEKKFGFYDISIEIKKAIKDIDDKIESLL